MLDRYIEWRVMRVREWSLDNVTSDADREAYIANVKFYLDELRSLIHDGLTGKSDIYLKVSFLDSVAAVTNAIDKALR